MNERRKTTRFVEKNNGFITFSIEKDHTNRDSKPVLTQDLSITGAKLLTNKPFPIDTRLLISLQLGKSKQIVELWARVLWIHSLKENGKYEIGVVFFTSLQTIQKLVQHLYGNEFQNIEEMSPQKEHFFPVDVSRA
ncbi:MAG: PilZ domain-containing protein [Candidatus Aminicenantes bacterium]|nr:PilZ domain-containing protein [Candidatus Aminicenantes bacterium]